MIPAGPLSTGHMLGRYEVLAKLASGGMAVVYIASAQGAAGFERIVAVKVLHANLAYEEEFISMFLDEARLAALIRHPNVVPTIDISDSRETGYFLVMEYIEGDHLGALLSGAHKAGASLPIPVVLRIAADALSGLSAAHSLRDDSGKVLSIVHRDVSPHNILVGRDGVSRLTDFGVAKAEDRLTHTRDGQVKGKLAYMAPEQASVGVSDTRSDLFSMGIILWECVTGRRLFRADSTAATLTKLLSEEIALPSAVDPELAPLDPVLRKALDREPSQRFQSAEEFIEAIEVAARPFGGLASRRAVGKAVKQYAAEKLARDRKLIASAKRRLQEGGAVSQSERPSERPPLGHSEASMSSLSRSKPSGVFSNLTAPGVLRRGRSARPAAAAESRAITGEQLLLQPPPPLGELGGARIPDLSDTPSVPQLFAAPSRARRRWMWSLVVIVVLAAGWALSRPTNSSEPPLRRISVTASTPPPAAELAPVQQAPSSTVPEAPQVAPSAPQPQVAREHTRTSSTKPSIDTHAVDPVSAKPQAAELRTVYSERPVDRSAPMPQQRRTQAQTPAQDAPSGATQEPSGDLLPNPYKQ